MSDPLLKSTPESGFQTSGKTRALHNPAQREIINEGAEKNKHDTK